MAYQYPNISRNDEGLYGPTNRGHFYDPVWYHQPNARKQRNKTRWLLQEPQQYEVFRVADEDYQNYSDESGGLYGFLDQMNEILGKDNEERIAYFPVASNPWHGYPITSRYIEDEMIEKWQTAGLINNRIYRHLLRHTL